MKQKPEVRRNKAKSSQCRICGSPSRNIFNKLFLQKYDVAFFECPECALVFTEHPYWLKEAYSSAISTLDVGLVSRNLHYAKILSTMLEKLFGQSGRYLDFAGGYGLFVRLMRDRGFDFFRQDKYCENIFSQNFDINNIIRNERIFKAVTAFEVFEHFADPLKDISAIFEFGETVIFSTELTSTTEDLQNWWYLSPESGQHIAFYSEPSLIRLAKIYSARLFTNHHDLHILTRDRTIQDPFPYLHRALRPGLLTRLKRKIQRTVGITGVSHHSKTEADHQLALQVLRSRKVTS